MQGADAVRENEGSENVEWRLLGHARESGKHDLLRMPLHHFQDRSALDLALGEQAGKDRRLENAEPDIEADTHEQNAEEERHPPAPGKKLLARHLTERKDCEIGEKKAARHAELRPR